MYTMVNYKLLIKEREYLPTELESITDPSLLDEALSAISRLESITGERFVYVKMYSKFYGWMRSQPVPITKKDTLDVFIVERYNIEDLIKMKKKAQENISSHSQIRKGLLE